MTADSSLQDFIARQIAKCHRGVALGQAMLDALPDRQYGESGWIDRCINAGNAIEVLRGSKEELRYWQQRATDLGL